MQNRLNKKNISKKGDFPLFKLEAIKASWSVDSSIQYRSASLKLVILITLMSRDLQRVSLFAQSTRNTI